MGQSQSIKPQPKLKLSINPANPVNPQPQPAYPKPKPISQDKIKAQWEWKSNANPWSSENAEWKPYTPLDNYLIERAYYANQVEVDLGDYIISIADMLQTKKGDSLKKRQVRRNEEYMHQIKVNEEGNGREQRFFGAVPPRTYNNAFGSLSNFLRFFENRGPEIKKFVNVFKETEDSQDLNQLNTMILLLLVDCIEHESKKIQKDRDGKTLILLFQKPFTTFQEFYGNVLKAYTIEGFLYKNLNRYLRNEDWIQLDSLLPYAYCLFKAFLFSELSSLSSSNPQNQLLNNEGNSKMTLYRGAQFDEILLSYYNPKTVRNFSWNGVTSTSTNRKVAENFMFSNVDLNKIPVLFTIEVLRSSDKIKSSNWIDIKPFSALPFEDEIVLAPGSVFELVSVSRDDKKGVEINLKLLTSISELVYQGQILHGAMQYEMIVGLTSRIMCFEGKELSEAILHLKGNRLIEELEFNVCEFNEKNFANLITTLPTISNLAKLAFRSSLSHCEVDFTTVFKHLRGNNLHIQTLEISDRVWTDHSLNSFASEIGNWSSLTALHLDFLDVREITDEGLKSLCCQGIKHLTKLTSLRLNFSDSGKTVTNKGLEILFSQAIQFLTSLTSLNIKFGTRHFNWLPNLMDNVCSQGIKQLSSLLSLDLNFHSFEYEITDKALKTLCCEGIKHLTKLTSLRLKFYYCEKVTDEGLKTLGSEGLSYLTSLRSLALGFDYFKEITDIGINNLCSEGIKHCALLTSLRLNFSSCNKITDAGVDFLTYEGIKHLTALTSLHLKFNSCKGITDKGLINLCSQGIRHLRFLTYLNLNFRACDGVTDKGVDCLWTEGIKDITSFKSLDLNFLYTKVSFDRIARLQEQTQQSKISLNAYEISSMDNRVYFFKRTLQNKGSKKEEETSNKVTKVYGDAELSLLFSKGTTHLSSLTNLHLSVFTDKGLETLRSEAIKYLTKITSLRLDFDQCKDITDSGLECLSSEVIRHLTALTSLHLDFTWCKKITNDGVNILCSQGIGQLPLLESLTLCFEGCDITDTPGIKYLTSLRALNLNFRCCYQFTDEGLNNLCAQGIRYLSSLTSLRVNFNGCRSITKDTLKNLQQILKYFGYTLEQSEKCTDENYT